MSRYVGVQCFCCGHSLTVDMSENIMVIPPIYSGLLFRATGNYGSQIFDPKNEEMLQILICDDCIKQNTERVIRIHNIKRIVAADEGKFTPS